MWKILRPLILVLSMLFVLLLGKVRGAEISSPMADIKETVEKLKKIVSDPDLKGSAKKQERYGLIRDLLIERIDFKEMAMSSLGRNWRKITEAQQTKYIEVFSNFLEAFYRERLFNSIEFLESSEVGVKYLKEIVEGDFASISIKISTTRGDDFSIIFKLHLVSGVWKAYDVVIENVSTIANWRAQFDRVILKKSFEKLLEDLEERTKELNK